MWNVRENGTRQRYPTRGSRIASVHRLPPFYKPPDGSQGRLARKCAAFDKRARRAGAQTVKARPAAGAGIPAPGRKDEHHEAGISQADLSAVREGILPDAELSAAVQNIQAVLLTEMQERKEMEAEQE